MFYICSYLVAYDFVYAHHGYNSWMAEVPRPDDIEPDFGYPTPEEMEVRIQYIEHGFREQPCDQSGVLKWPAHIRDIDTRVRAARHKEFVYNRGQTRIIPERILKESDGFDINAIYDMMNVYYWWNVDATYGNVTINPEWTLETLLEDLNTDQFAQAIRVLHGEFSAHCKYSPKNGICDQDDGMRCYERKVEKLRQNNRKSRFVKPFRPVDQAMKLFKSALYDKEYDYSPLYQKLGDYNVNRLADAGLDDLEAMDSRNVFELESTRRGMAIPGGYYPQPLTSQSGYTAYRLNGGSFEDYLEEVSESFAASSDMFKETIDEFEDVPDTAMEWPPERKLALARRAVHSSADDFMFLEMSHQWHQDGVLPPYLYRFRPAFTDGPI